jgi:DNA-binding transcriptional LysR family regulator
MNDWDNYRLILALHRTGTLRGAALWLKVNHSTVSRRLAWLNKEYESDVFERTTDGYRPTSLGNQLITAAERIEDIAISTERRKRASATNLSGEINLSVPPPIAQHLLLQTMNQFSIDYPLIRLNINSSFQLLNLDRSEADIVIRGTNAPPEHLVGRRIGSMKLNYYAHQDYFDNNKPDEYRWIGRNAQELNPDWINTSPYPDAPIGIRSDDILMRHYFTMAGFGMTRTACYMGEQAPMLKRISNAPPVHYSDLWVLTHPDLRDTPKIKTLMQAISESLSAQRDLIEGRL